MRTFEYSITDNNIPASTASVNFTSTVTAGGASPPPPPPPGPPPPGPPPPAAQNPVITTGNPTVTFTGQSPVALDLGVTIADTVNPNALVDAAHINTIGASFLLGDVLSAPDQFGITAEYSASDGDLTLIGTTTLANYQTELREITFTTTLANTTETSRTFSWQFEDSTNPTGPMHFESNIANSTIALAVPAHTATVAVGATTTFVEKQASSVIIEGAASFTDSDPISQVQIALPASQFLNGFDMLGFQSGSGISNSITLSVGSTFGGIAGDGSTFSILQSGGTWTITSTGAVTATNADFEAASREVAFMEAAGLDPTADGPDTVRQFIWTIVDNDPTGHNTFSSGTRNADGSITSTTSDAGFSLVNVKHLATVAVGNNLTFVEGQTSPVVLESRVTFSDTDNITSVVLSLPGTQALSNDRIGFLNAAGTDLVTQTTLTQGQSFNIGGIQFTGDGSELQIARSGGTLTITSIGTVAASNLDFEIVSREVAYTAQTSTGQTTDPTAGGGDTVRDIIWSITDNAGTFASGTRNADGSFTATPGVATVKGGTILNVQHSAIVAAGNDSSFVEGQTAKVVIEPFASFTDTNNITSVVLTLPMIPARIPRKPFRRTSSGS